MKFLFALLVVVSGPPDAPVYDITKMPNMKQCESAAKALKPRVFLPADGIVIELPLRAYCIPVPL